PELDEDLTVRLIRISIAIELRENEDQANCRDRQNSINRPETDRTGRPYPSQCILNGSIQDSMRCGSGRKPRHNSGSEVRSLDGPVTFTSYVAASGRSRNA